MPHDIDPGRFAAIVTSKVGGEPPTWRRHGTIMWPLEIAADGRALIPEHRVARIGSGSIKRGTEILNRIAADFRLHRLLKRAGTTVLWHRRR